MMILSALWLGILTSVSPCPLATNLAAVAFLSRKISSPGNVLFSGLAYTLGRTLAYAAIGSAIILSLTGISAMANFLQNYMNKILGPLLFVAGLVLLGVIKIRLPGSDALNRFVEKRDFSGVCGSFSLGVIFALAFCPISAALFFGSLIPLALKSGNGAILPFVYGIGTALPVGLFAFAMALGLKSVLKWFYNLEKAELFMRRLTGVVFILIGMFYMWIYIIVPFLGV